MSTSAANLVSPHDQRVTFVELFFDLVFVFCITQIVKLLHGHMDAAAVGSALLVFWLVWWAWTQFAWALNAANTDHPRVQLTTLLATAVAFMLAANIPRALGDGAMWFAAAYVVLRVIGLLLYHQVASSDPDQRTAVRVFGTMSGAGSLPCLPAPRLAAPRSTSPGRSRLVWILGQRRSVDVAKAGIFIRITSSSATG